MPNLGQNRRFFGLCDLDLWPLTMTFCMDISSANGNNSWKFHDDTTTGTLWKMCDRRTDRQTERKKCSKGVPLLYYIKLCASFQSHRWIQAGVRKCSIRVKIDDFLSCVTLKSEGWPRKSIGHLFYTTSSFVHHFKAISESKLESQSGNAEFASKSSIFPAWPRNLTDDLKNNRAPLPY